jgi:hypothetical protein
VEDLKDFVYALSRIILGLIILVGALVLLDLGVYLGATGSTFGEKVALAYSSGYDQAYTGTYQTGYDKAYGKAYSKGYIKGYELGLENLKGEDVSLVQLHNPTYQEMKDFLAADNTNENEYITGSYVCYDFAADVNNNAEAAGIRAAYVRIRSSNWAHALVAFQTVDRGLIFIEPQSDKEVTPEVGKPYPWWQVGAASPLSHNADLTEIDIIW